MFDLYADDVYRFSFSLIGNRDDAMDVVQEVFFRAYKGWNQFRHDSAPKTWLFQIARNYINDLYRKKRSNRVYIDNYISTFDEKTTSFEEWIEIRDAISKLNENHRQVILLRFIHDLSVEDSARILGWSEAKVRTTQHRALKQLRGLIGDHILTESRPPRGR
ncbi:ECF RNA polymerase sigma factor SigX [Alicyclobacillus acidoterrestris]|nr:ECF RNA polymerase sigma factor SigX [Alicyclobacillus acidoterrestris]